MSLKFDGIDDGIASFDSISVGTGNLTICTWFLPLADPGDNASIINLIINDSANFLNFQDTVGNPSTIFNVRRFTGTDSQRTALDNGFPKNNKWYWLASWHNGGTNTSTSTKIFKDGFEVTYDFTGNATLVPENMDNSIIYICRNSANTSFLNSYISQVHIYNRILSNGEINHLMRFPGSIRYGLLGYFPLNGFSANEPDYSENKNFGIVTGAIKGDKEPPINGMFGYSIPVLQMAC